MAPDAFFYAIEILISVALLMWFFERPWQAFCIDASRQRYFELRNRLFILAAERRVSFEDPIYMRLREWLNNRIRLAHINVFGDIFALLIACRGAVPRISTIGAQIEKVEDSRLRKDLKSIYYQAIHIQIQHMVVRSPVILVLTVLAPLVVLVELINGSVRAVSRWLTDLAQIADDDKVYGATTTQS